MLMARPSSDQQSQNFQELGIYIFSKHCIPPFTPNEDTDNGVGLGQLSLAIGSRGVGFSG